MGIGLFGGGNSKQSTTSTTTLTDYTNTNSVDSVQGGFQPVTVNGDGNSIQTTDFRAVAAGTELAQQALETGGAAFESFASKLGAQSDSIVNKSLGIAAKSQTSEGAQMQDTLVKVALIGAVGLGLYALAKGRA